MKNWIEDKDLEKAMLQTSLFFRKARIKDSRASLFHKYILALIISRKAKNKEELLKCYQHAFPNNYIDNNQIDSALSKLCNIVSVDVNGMFIIDEKTQNESEEYLNRIQKDLDKIVEDVFISVKRSFTNIIPNENQVKTNIKDCFEYYFKVASISFFGLDERKEINEYEQIEFLAKNNLKGQSDELFQQIIYSIGQVINKPNQNQSNILEEMARIHVTAQVMNMDPMLASFNAVQLRSKTFILDTDVVLHAITKNAQHSKQYKMMLDQLIKCGCNIYIPQEVIQEVYNHAEASIKRYPFVSELIGIDDEDAPKSLKNVFIEDYHYTKLINKAFSIDWSHYIQNYYHKDYGITLITEEIKDALGNKINYGYIPQGAIIKPEEKDALYEKVLAETQKTDKAFHREYEKNEDIANADTVIYLSIKSLNGNSQNGGAGNQQSDVLMKDYYFLSSSTRVYLCAKELGLDSKLICNPRELIAYLSETGNLDKENIKFTQLFDNPFLAYTAKIVADDIDTLLKAGVDLRGRKIVRMRFELSEEIQSMLTISNTEEYMAMYEEVKNKGYSFKKAVSDAIEDSNAGKKQIEQLVIELSDANKTIESQKNEIAKLKYLNRVQKKTIKNKKK